MVACLLPDGTIQNMTPEDCLAAAGRFGDDLINLRGDLEHSLNNLGGSIDGGIGLGELGLGGLGGFCQSGPACANLSYEECLNSSDCNWSGDLRITSLLNLHKDVTVRKAIKNKGKRYGFYQRVIKNK